MAGVTAQDEARRVLADMLDKARLMDEAGEGVWPTPQRIREWHDAIAALLEENKAQAKRLDELKTALRRIIVAGNDQAAIAKAALEEASHGGRPMTLREIMNAEDGGGA